MEYSIGQTVNIIKKVDLGFGELWVPDMDNTIGLTGIIIEVARFESARFYKVELYYTSTSYSEVPIIGWWWYCADALSIEPAIEANPLKFEYLVVFKEKFENSARVSHSYYSTTEEFVTFWGGELEWCELVQSSKRPKQ